MKNNEESSFLQGVENRLDSLFAESTPKVTEKDSKPSQATVQNVAPDIKEDIPEIQKVKAPEIKPEPSSEPIQATDKSHFISEIEKRFSAIFGEEEKKDVFATREVEKPAEVMEKIEGAGPEEKVVPAEPPEDITPPPSEYHSPLDDLSAVPSSEYRSPLDDLSTPSSSIYNSPLKDMKSVILSIEWEINDHILEQLEDEINKLYFSFTGDRIVQGFLRIIRFLGRYVRVRGQMSSQDSINLLLSVYDHFENVMVTDKMPEAKKYTILLDNIKRYRAWVDSTDLHEFEVAKEAEELEITEAVTEALKPSEGKPLPEEQSIIEKKEEIKPLEIEPAHVELVSGAAVAPPVVEETVQQEVMEEQAVKEEKEELKIEGFEPVKEEPVSEAPILAAAAVEESLQQEAQMEAEPEKAIKEPEITALPEPAPMAASLPLGYSKKMEGILAEINDQPTREAFSCALEEIKNMFQSELDALKEEIRSLKNTQ
ncbi:MAG: hypothetical protein PHN98_09665 [Smithellaceae bacterium]|nr:hypothetical protein [Smithellaceae bacterium]